MSVSVSGIGNTQPNLHFFQYIQAYKPFADPVPPNTKQYQLLLTKYQPVSSYTDPIPSSTTYNSSSRKEQFSQLNNFFFLWLIWWVTHSILGLVYSLYNIVKIFLSASSSEHLKKNKLKCLPLLVELPSNWLWRAAPWGEHLTLMLNKNDLSFVFF